MRRNLLKLSIIGLVFATVMIFEMGGLPVGAFSGGPPPSRTGAPALGTFPQEPNCTVCHAGTVNSGGGTVAIGGIPSPATYSPNQEITLTFTVTQAQAARFGFEMTALTDQGQKAGDFIPLDSRTQLASGTGSFNGRQYIQHTFDGGSPTGPNTDTWTFKWRAPANSVGKVTFYVAGNAANNNGANTGDSIYTTSASIDAAPVLGAISTVSGANYTSPLTNTMIAVIYGANLRANIIENKDLPLPTVLDGTEVKVKDAAGTERSAGLFFASPGQINYLVPTETVLGQATVTVHLNGSDIAQGTIPVETVNPGIFTATSDGNGIAAAQILRRRDGVDTYEPVVQFNPTSGKFEAIPIDLGPETDLVALILYATGVRGRSSLDAVTCTIGGTDVGPVLFAGKSTQFDGLDQVNVPLPRTLINRGDVQVVLKVDNKTANTVTINFK